MEQYGSGMTDIGRIYRGPFFSQRGRGVGDIFNGFLRYLTPMFRSGMHEIKKQGIKSARQVLDEISAINSNNNKTLTDILREQGKLAASELALTGINKLKRKLKDKTSNQGGMGVLDMTNTAAATFSAPRSMRIKRPRRPKKKVVLKKPLKRPRAKPKKGKKKTVKRRRKKTKKRYLDIFD